MKVFVTGGEGFVSEAVIRKFLARGHDVSAQVQAAQAAARLSRLGVKVVAADLTDTDAMREAMRSADVVMHSGGSMELGTPDPDRMEQVNVGATRKVLRLARELGVPKIVVTSTVEIFGDTKGQTLDETSAIQGPYPTERARTKALAQLEVARPQQRSGAPIIILMTGSVFGPGGSGLITDMMRGFYRGYPVAIGTGTVLTFAHVDDIAEGHVLAAEKGKVGETYILSGPAVPLGDMLDFWSYLTGRKAPAFRIPASVAHRMETVLGLFGRMVGLESAFSPEAARMAGATFITTSEKARRELGWEPRPLQGAMLETLRWIAATEQDRASLNRQREIAAAMAAIAAAGMLLFAWLLSTRRKG